MISAKKRGFTLIELMVVIAIIAVLAAVATPQVFKQIQKGRVAAATGFSGSIKTAATSYFSDRNVWPATCVAAVGLSNCNTIADGFVTGGSSNWDGPYLDRWPSAAANPWGGDYDWTNASGILFGTAAVGERYLIIAAVPTADAQKLDLAKDGVLNSASGMVRAAGNVAWPASGTITVWVLVSRDGAIV